MQGYVLIILNQYNIACFVATVNDLYPYGAGRGAGEFEGAFAGGTTTADVIRVIGLEIDTSFTICHMYFNRYLSTGAGYDSQLLFAPTGICDNSFRFGFHLHNSTTHISI